MVVTRTNYMWRRVLYRDAVQLCGMLLQMHEQWERTNEPTRMREARTGDSGGGKSHLILIERVVDVVLRSFAMDS